MADDIQLKVGIDLDALKNDAEKAAQVLAKSFQGAMAGVLGQIGAAATGGAGGAPAVLGQAAPAGATSGSSQVGLDDLQVTLQAILTGITALSQLQTTQINQQAQIAQQANGAPTPVGVNPAGNGQSTTALKPQMSPWSQALGDKLGLFGPRGGIGTGTGLSGATHGDRALLGALGHAGRLGGQASQAVVNAMGRGQTTDYVNLGLDAVSWVGNTVPGWGGVASAAGAIREQSAKTDRTRNTRYEMFRDVGGTASSEWNEAAHTDRERLTYKGIGPDEYRHMLTANAHATGRQKVSPELETMGAKYGMFDQATGMLGAATRAGANLKGPDGEQKMLADVLAVAVASGLDRSRWAEVPDLLKRQYAQSVHGDADSKRAAWSTAFTNSLGSRYAGGTAAHDSFEAGMDRFNSDQGMAGEVSYNAYMEQEKSQGREGTYEGYQLALSRGNNSKDGISKEAVIRQVVKSGDITAFLAGSRTKQDIERTSKTLADIYPQLKQAEWADVLIKLAGAVRPEDVMNPLKEINYAAIAAELVRPALPSALMEFVRGNASKGWTDMLEVFGGRVGMKDPNDDSTGKIERGPKEVANDAAEEAGRTGKFKNRGAIPSVEGPASAGAPSFLDRINKFTGAVGVAPVAPTPTITDALNSVVRGSSQSVETQQFTKDFVTGATPHHGDLRKMKDGTIKKHPGTDLVFPPGTPVFAPVDGKVEAARELEPGTDNGAYISIIAGDGKLWKILHLDLATVAVRPGDTVKDRETFLGRSLAFKAWKNGVPTHVHVGVHPKGSGGKAGTDLNSDDFSDDFRDMVGPSVKGGRATGTAPATPAERGGGGGGGGTPLAFDVRVRDERVSVTRVASRGRRNPGTRIG